MKSNYHVIKHAIPVMLANFINDYFLLKRQVAATLFKNRDISQFNTHWGIWNDRQVPDTYSHYGDIAMEVLLAKVKPAIEKKTGLSLIETYSYARIYKKGDVLHRHKDRYSCEVSATMNLGGDNWPIYLEPSGKEGKKGTKIILKPGDLLIYKGCDVEHWREVFQGEYCSQVFLHYNNASSKKAMENKFDTREHLGLPGDCRRLK